MKIAINPSQSDLTQTNVICKDGTTKIQLSSPTGKYADTCMNNGGRAENQPKAIPIGSAPALPTKTEVSIYKKLAGAYNQNLIIAGVLVAGYFAYKKFKK